MKFIEITGSATLNTAHIVKVFRKTVDVNTYRVTVISVGQEVTFWDFDSYDACENHYKRIVNKLIPDDRS